ncbi:MAG: Crp/Fnr family transcriptional regulator [Chitinophagaceae bacterium]|nr:MAG: Crp/Fnr family transcriptional regulator [Chitinophagaceae bacterium]
MQTGCDLDTCFLCSHCLPEWKELVAIRKTTRVIRKGKAIFREGEPVEGLYFLIGGSAKVSTRWGGQKELILRFAKAGQVLGHRGVGGSTYPISATALEDCRVCFIDNTFLESTLRANPGFTYSLMQVYAAELHAAEQRMRDLAHRDVKGRIALALLAMEDFFGTNDTAHIALPLSRQDIASYAGSTYETVFKFFNELLTKGILASSGKSLRILDRGRLEAQVEAAAHPASQ